MRATRGVTTLSTVQQRRRRALRGTLLIVGSLAGGTVPAARLEAQSLVTVAIQGTVRMADFSDPDGATVAVRNALTGFLVESGVWRGRFTVPGLEPGGPYTITVRRIGAVAQQWDGVFLTLGEGLELDITLDPLPLLLDSIVVATERPSPLARRHGGTATTLPDSLIQRLPSLNRDVYDFLRLVPQISTRIGFEPGGMSGGGVGFRFNGFLINGVPERSLAGGQPPEFAGGRSLPFEAVREYQVLVAPFDVRYGDFAGAMVNTVAQTGTNRFAGSAFAQGRSDALARDGLGAVPYERWQAGASVSGPIVRDRLHFFLAAEAQRRTSPMTGPYSGQPEDASPPAPVSDAEIERLNGVMAPYGLVAGSGEAVSNRNRVHNLFGRVDGSIPGWNTRAALWLNMSETRNRAFTRAAAPDTFLLSSHAADQAFTTQTLALQLFTSLRRPGGGHNQLSVSHRTIPFRLVPVVRQPVVAVTVPAATGGTTELVTGSLAHAQGGAARTWSVDVRDDLTLPLGRSHVASIGLEAEWFHVGGTAPANSYGTWRFESLDSLEAGQAQRFDLARDFGSATVPISGIQVAVYAGDSWRIRERLWLTLGLRAEILDVNQRAPYNPTVQSLFGRRTDQGPGRAIHLSPRLGFTWDPSGSARDLVRGGVGIFTGRPPLAWLHVPIQRYGVGIGTLQCGAEPGDLGPPPAFQPDPGNPPVACGNGAGLAAPPPGDVELLASDLGMAQTIRAVLAYERRLPGDLVGTLEALVTRHLSDFAFVNLNLAGPQGTDRRGRILYGSTDSLGRARPTPVTTAFPSVIELRNVSGNHAVQLAVGLTRRFSRGFAALGSYTWSRVRDAQTPLRVNTRGIVNWALRAVSGNHDDLSPGISLNQVPHRFVVAGTWRAPWPRWVTEVSLLYVAESGSPFTWIAGGSGRRGDLNADGALNDPIYVPRNARDPDEIAFTGLIPGGDNSAAAQAARMSAQRDAFERFIEDTPCLRRQRGRIVERNSCREPWAQTTVASLRQTLPAGGRVLDVQLDVFNVLNLLYHGWGHRRLASPVVLDHVTSTESASGQREPVFRLVESATRWRLDPVESAFQLQLGVRYRF